jgi:hypothetical protein
MEQRPIALAKKRRRRRDLIERLLSDMVADGGRLIIGVFNEERGDRATERDLTEWGFRVAGAYERLHTDTRLAYRIAWIDR